MEGDLPQVNAAPEVVEEPQPEQAVANGEAAAAEGEDAAVAAEHPAAAEGEQEQAGEYAAATAEKPAAGEEAEQKAAPAADGDGDAKPKAAPPPAPKSGEGQALPNRPPQVFFSGAPTGVKRDEVEEVFGTYGKVVRIELLSDYATRQTRGNGFVRYAEQQAAADAIAALHQNYTFPGGSAPMTVRWAGGEAPDRKRKAPAPREEEPISTEDQRQLFLAKITRQIPEEAIVAVLGQYGTVENLRMFKPTPDAVYHKGCGVVTYSRNEEAEYAMRALDEVYVWEGMREPMIAKYNESEANKRRREEDMRNGPHYVSLEQPPPGCDMDALKVFVDNLPTIATVEDIHAVFKGFGRIVQIAVARDKETNEPKGSAYIWYQRRRDADFAVRRMNGNTTAFAGLAGPADEPAVVAGPPEKPVEEGEAAAAPAEPAKPAEPKKLVVKIAMSSTKILRPGERPPAWMRQAGGPPPGFGGPPQLGMPPMRRGPPPGAFMGGPPAPYGMGGPPPMHGGYGPPPMGGPPGYGGPQGGYGAGPGGYGAPAPAGPYGGYGGPAPAGPGGYGAPAPQQAPPQAYQQAPPAAAAQPAPYQQPYQQQQPAAAQPGAGAYGQAQPGGYAGQAQAQAAPAAGGYDYSAYYAQQAQQAQQPQQAAGAQDGTAAAYAAYYAQQAGGQQQQVGGAAPQQAAAAAPAGAYGYGAAAGQGQAGTGFAAYGTTGQAQAQGQQQGQAQAQPVGGYASYAAPAQQGQQQPAQQQQYQQGYGYGAPAAGGY